MKTDLLSNLSKGLKKGTGLTQVGYRQGTGKVQAGEKQACDRKESLAWSQVEPILYEAAIEQPLSTHSAPFGIRWKPAGEKGSSRVWKHVAMIFAVLVMSMANIGMAWGADATGTWSVTSANTAVASGDVTVSAFTTNGITVNASSASRNDYYRDVDGNKWQTSASNDVYLQFVIKAKSEYEFTLTKITAYLRGESSNQKFNIVYQVGSTTGAWTTVASAVATGSSTTLSKFEYNVSTFSATTEDVYVRILPYSSSAEKKKFRTGTVTLTGTTAAVTPACDAAPADPTGLAVSSITAGGATFTITDGANTNNYEIVCKTTSGAPAVDATPTKTGTDKTLAVTELEDGTTYYAWVRSVCDASYKSGWVALGSGTFTTKSCSISECGNATLTYPIYTSGNLTTSNLFSGATSSNATAVSVGSSPAFTGVTVSAATKGSSANAGACYAKSTPLTGKMQYSASSKSSSYYIDFPFTVNTGYTFTPCDVQVVIQPVSSDQTFTVEITNGTNVYGTSTATLTAGVMEPIIGLTSTAEMSAGNYAVRLYPHGGSSKEFRMGANVILKGTTASAVASDAYGIYIGKNNDNYTLENLTNTSGTTWSKTITLDAGSYYEFKVKKTPSAGDAVWYGNNGKITATTSPAWDFNTSDGNCKLYTTVAGSYTFSWDASTNKLTITYPAGDHPTKRIYMACGSGTWCDATPKFFVHSWGVTEYNTQVQQNACGEYYADIIWYNDYFQFTRNNSTATAYDDQNWNYSQDLTYNSSQLLWTFSGWSGSTGNFSSSAYTPTTYTITYAANGGGGSMSATSGICLDADQAITSNAFTAPTGCASFAHWTANVAVKVDGATVAAGNPIANGATIQDINSDITLTAVWKLATPTITDNGDNTFSISGSMAGSSYYYTTNGGTPTTSSSLYSSAVDFSAGEANITAKAIAHKDGYVDSDVASQACTYHAPVTCTGDPTALVSGTLYQVSDMASACLGELTSTGQYFYGLSSNGKFYINGTTNSNNASTGTVEIKTASNTIDAISFTGIAWFKGAGTNTCRSIKFVVPSAGTLTIYGKTSSGNGNVVIKTESSGNTTVIANSVNAYASGSTTVSAGTYYVLSDGGSAAIVGLKFVESACTTPAAPTAFSAGSITSTGATFSITDAGDAASYDIYYATSSTAPTASTPATTTSTSKTKAVTGLTASTTYYAWVRSVCDASHKSDWVALSGSSFTTTSTPAELTAIEANVLYQAADMANITFTGADQWFAGLSTNAKFNVYGDGSSTSAFGKNENHSVTDDIDTKNFTSALYITAANNTSSTSDPTKGAIEFITPSTAGTLYLYLNTASSGLSIKKKGTSTSTSLSGGAYKKITVEANTHYFINGAGSNRGLYGIKFIADVTAPTFVSSVPANGATGVATSGTIVLTFSEALGTIDASKFTLTGATKGAVAIDGTDATKVNITYSGAAEESTVTLATAAAAVSDLAGNALASALSDISFTTAAAAPAGDCITIAYFETTSHNNSSSKPDNAGKYIYGYTNSAKTEAYAYTITTGSTNNKGQGTGASDYLRMDYGTTVNIYADNTTTGGTPANFSNVTSVSVDFKMNNSSYYTTFDIFVGSTKIANNVSLEGAAQSAFTTFTYNNLEQLNGKISIVNKGSGSTNFNFHIDNVQICTSSLPACTTPVLPTLTAKTVCEGGDAADAWDATITNSGSLASGETVAYSWVKKGSSTVLSSVATYQPTDVTEAMAGTYVVTATVSADGKASKSASQEVDLAVNATVEISSVTQSPATVYAGNSVTLTATANVSATWQWYTCTNAEGDGESSIGGATSAAYAFAAPASAGTYYYKVKATGPCGGVATEVYALTVSAATGGDCDTYYFFANAADATTNSVTQNEESFFSGASEGTNNNSTSITVDENSLSISKRTSAGAYSVVFTVPTGATATLYTNAKANNTSYPLIITRSSDSEVMEITNSTTLANYTLADIPEGTWTLSSGSGKNWYYGAIIVKVCTGATCTDPAVTATVSKSNVCAGSGEGVTFTASDAHASATYKWQKQNGSAWEDISGATAATYTITTVEASHAGKYRVVASHDCDRISNELTLTVATTPVFGDLGGAREVETGGSLSITDIEATSATSYKWYKSANATYDSGSDEQVGTSKNLMLPVNETAGSTFYLFCVASNACTSTVSSAITVSVIAPVEKDCAVGTSNGENFTTAKTSSVSSGTYNSQTELHMNSNNKYIYYVAATGYHFETATVNCCAGDATALTKAAYSYSTDGGETWTDADLPGAMTNQYSNHVVNLTANVNAFRVGRVLGDHGVGSNTLYVHEVCFTYVADCNATTIAISNATPSYDLSVGGDFTEPTCTVKQGGTTLSPQPTLRYSSFNEDIATVDPSTGDVDFTGTAGSVMIMASYDGDETYCESSATYTITVSCGSESAPKIVAGSGTNLSGCNAEVNLVVKDQNDNDFASGSYQWYRDGEEIDGANSATYTANRTGTYTVSHTGVCTQMSTNSAVVTSESFDPSVERLVPFQYYHANKTYTDQMKMRHLFAVTSGGDYEGKRYYMTATRNGASLDITTSTAFSVRTSNDNRVDSVMIDLNRLNGKFNAGDEIVLTCAAIADCGTISAVTEDIEIHVIDNTPTLALICSGTNKSAGTRKTSEMTVGGDFLTGYNKADLCEQTGNTSFDANTEWGLYTDLKANYIVTPVNGYAVFNKLNYEPFDILLLTDYPKASKSTEAALVLDDMYELCDYRPMLSFKTHMVQPADKLDGRESHWKKKGFTTLPEAITKGDGRLKMNIVCYAHPMFEEITEGAANDYDDESQIVYTMLSGPGHEGSKGMQGFHLAAAENFVTIGLVHYNATATDNYDGSGNVKWTPGSGDEMLVAAAERQTNLEARFILFSLNCGAQSKLTAQGNTVVLKCLEYLLNDATIEGNVADCALTFDNKAGDHKWSNKANWAPKYSAIPGEYNATRIAAPATVDMPHAKVMSVRIKEGGSIYIPAGSALDVKSTVRHKDVGSDVRPTDVDEIHIGSSASGNGTLIFNNNTGDTKARVDMYSNAQADITNMSAATSVWQYIGTPHTDVANARNNYYGSWLYQYVGGTWTVIPNGGPLEAFRGYCITNETAPIVYDMEGTLAATTTQDIAIPAGYTVIANSWVAPIDINAITDDDMEGISDKAVYFFNTGHDANGEEAGTPTQNATGDARWAAGTYVSVPIHSAPYTSGSDDHIPSMQGFYVWSTDAGTLHLDYDRHVRPSTDRSILSGRMHAPRRAAAESSEPNVLKIFARGSRYDDRLIVLEREDFTRQYESGWDGEAWGGSDLSPMVYITNEAGVDEAVSAIPEFEGTVIAFKAGEDNDYHFDFIYDGEESLYLFDTENSTYTQIMTGESYYFSTDDKAPHSRFILTRRGPQIATGIEPTSDSSLKGRAKKLLIENKMYILLNGALYDATGKAVK